MDTRETLGTLLRMASGADAGDRLAPYAPPGPITGPVIGPGEGRTPQPGAAPKPRPDLKRAALALGVAAASDVLGWAVEFAPPLQWGLDLLTALLLFVILGRRWAILPGLVAEAIPGLAVFPVWILVVISIVLYDDIRKRKL